MKLDNKVAIVTGGGSGIGRAAALAFAREGAAVAVVGRSREKAEMVASEISSAGGRAVAFSADVAVSDQVQRMENDTDRALGGVDVLFNNAGVSHDHDIAELPEDEWDRVVDTCLKGTYLGCKFAIPFMKQRGGGAIVNTSALSGLFGNRRRAAYCAAKGGIIAMTKSIAYDCAPYHIRVNAIAPAATDTPAVQARMLREGAQPVLDWYRKTMPIGRALTADEVARVALFLAADDSFGINGMCIPVDAGLSAFNPLQKR